MNAGIYLSALRYLLALLQETALWENDIPDGDILIGNTWTVGAALESEMGRVIPVGHLEQPKDGVPTCGQEEGLPSQAFTSWASQSCQ